MIVSTNLITFNVKFDKLYWTLSKYENEVKLGIEALFKLGKAAWTLCERLLTRFTEIMSYVEVL